jgi:hypothetical protein
MISVRPYASADYEAVSALYKNSANFGGQFDEDRDSEERLDEQCTADPKSILVAEVGSEVVGTVSILADKRFAWLMRFAVRDPQAVEALCDKACEVLKERGHSQVLVYAPSGDPSFKSRYQSLGFSEGEQSYNVFWRFFK